MENDSKEIYCSPVSSFSGEYEICVMCGEVTDIKSSSPIVQRKYYVYGAGQLCQVCWRKLYGQNIKNDDTIM